MKPGHIVTTLALLGSTGPAGGFVVPSASVFRRNGPFFVARGSAFQTQRGEWRPQCCRRGTGVVMMAKKKGGKKERSGAKRNKGGEERKSQGFDAGSTAVASPEKPKAVAVIEDKSGITNIANTAVPAEKPSASLTTEPSKVNGEATASPNGGGGSMKTAGESKGFGPAKSPAQPPGRSPKVAVTAPATGKTDPPLQEGHERSLDDMPESFEDFEDPDEIMNPNMSEGEVEAESESHVLIVYQQLRVCTRCMHCSNSLGCDIFGPPGFSDVSVVPTTAPSLHRTPCALKLKGSFIDTVQLRPLFPYWDRRRRNHSPFVPGARRGFHTSAIIHEADRATSNNNPTMRYFNALVTP
ncbi:unnamed protein product [Discosporangium mesarthrocarpum]